MAVTMQRVLAELGPDEPRYDEAAERLGPEALPFLMELVQAGDVGIAAKAASLAGSLRTNDAIEVLAAAARREDAVVRVVAAAALRNLPEVPVDLAEALLTDRDAGVRKLALTSIEFARPAGLRDRVRDIAASDPVGPLRDLAGQVAQELP